MNLRVLNIDELVGEVQHSKNPTELELALCSKLIDVQKIIESITKIVEEEL